MKIYLHISIVIALLLNISVALTQQTLVNTSWTTITGLPQEYDWSATCTDPYLKLCTTGNTDGGSQNANILTTKYNLDGTIAWQVQWNGSTSGADYGTAIVATTSAVYVAGATYNETNDDYDYVVLKYNSTNGSLSWSYIYSDAAGGHDIASDIAVDSQGNVFVTGARQGSSTLADYCTIKLNSSGSQQWVSTYDYNSMYDGAAKIVVYTNGTCAVTGGSGNSWADGDFATVRYSSSGSQISVQRTENSSFSFDQPMDMKRDANDNIYVVGRVGSTSNGFDIKLLKMDEELNLIWTVTQDGYGNDDMGQSLELDGSNNILVTGYMTNDGGKKELCVLKYNNSGALQWEKKRASAYQGDAMGWKVTEDNGRIYVVGDYTTDLGTDIISLAYDSNGNEKWLRTFDGGSGEDDSGRHAEIGGIDILYASGKVKENGVTKYVDVRYEAWERPMNQEYFGTEPMFVDNEIVLWFDTSVVNLSAVNDKGRIFGALSDFVETAAIEELNDVLDVDLKNQKTIKVFERWTSDIDTSVARDGELIPVPPFWSSFVITLPSSIDEIYAVDTIANALWPTVRIADMNWLYGLYEDANDPEYANQESLFESDPNVVNHINIEPAWDIRTGESYVKVGVYDTGIEWSHEDFGDGTFEGSSIEGGWDWINNQYLYNLQSDVNGHGTAITGIIGARRNNETGIAGIAGGDWTDTNDPHEGVQLFGFKIISDDNSSMTSMDNVVDGLIEGALCVPDEFGNCTMGYGLHVMNNSWGLQGFYDMTNEQQATFQNHQTLMSEAIHQVAANGCVNVIAAGNSNTDYGSSPANTLCPETYAIQVGASNLEGKKMYNSNWGVVDFLAPGDPNLTLTTSNVDDQYVAFSATSCAAPHVAGTASLLISEVLGNWEAPNILHPEDVEHLLQNHTYDIDPVNDPDNEYFSGFDSKSGWGLVDAGNTLFHTNLPYYKVRHYEASLNSGNVAASDENVYVFVEGNPDVPNGEYLADVFLMEKTINYDLGSETALNVWTRDAHSTPVYCFNVLPRYPAIELTGWNQNSATVQGCVYHFNWQLVGGNIFPVDIWYPHTNNTGTVAISVHTFDSTIGVEEYDESGVILNAFPNPSSNEFQLAVQLQISGSLTIEVFDALGQRVYEQSLLNAKPGLTVATIPAVSWSSGIYVCQVRIADSKQNTQLLKE